MAGVVLGGQVIRSFTATGTGIGISVARSCADTFRTGRAENLRNRRNRFYLPGFGRAVATTTDKPPAIHDAASVPSALDALAFERLGSPRKIEASSGINDR